VPIKATSPFITCILCPPTWSTHRYSYNVAVRAPELNNTFNGQTVNVSQYGAACFPLFATTGSYSTWLDLPQSEDCLTLEILVHESRLHARSSHRSSPWRWLRLGVRRRLRREAHFLTLRMEYHLHGSAIPFGDV
jgi:hypothetical protein